MGSANFWKSLIGAFVLFTLFLVARIVFGVKDTSHHGKKAYPQKESNSNNIISIAQPPCPGGETTLTSDYEEIVPLKVGSKLFLPSGRIIAACIENTSLAVAKKNPINDRTFIVGIKEGYTKLTLTKSGEIPEVAVVRLKIISNTKKSKR